MTSTDQQALHLALELARSPALARAIRDRPLPSGVLTLIRIAAGSHKPLSDATRLTGEDAEAVKAAAELFLQQNLLQANGNHYRTLGVSATASRETLAEHVRWLMKWLHPDRDRAAWDSAFSQRVLDAWHELKDPERRARYDRSLSATSVAPMARRPRQQRRWLKSRLRRVAITGKSGDRIRRSQVLIALLVFTAGTTIVLLSDEIIPPLIVRFFRIGHD
ncbi:J domain-containing protein (plasmid) [Bradyrhizobium sp. ISRA443]|uniref:J domain-containing protein n=1 Tax=unclassified Bradyrhizobium TaxID=2631580 RepID=UPI00247A23D7|nr:MULTISPECIES: DnaJ domain-containing protein [unclassified Bradyrhizobium]WGR90808.1 J domain-containing protein [Bradyrhizobium sp. ISRA435]WGS03061.1 J domain-containing protein [Bradyrhizobium sp. ISRA436]WGS09905.1 J domain-containing protein [Bradyrhizobium sp. ISRA437]WGS16790.1 J domain-containing protein [Bradyrhizobium sp. ISRA443]